MDRYEISEVNLGKKQIYLFDHFEVCFLISASKEETMRNIHNQNMTE